MRPDSLGMFWQDEPAIKKMAAERIKRTPPEKFWLAPGYIPDIEFDEYSEMSDTELIKAQQDRDSLIFDTEVYPNYFLIAFKNVVSGKVVYFEKTDNENPYWNKLEWIIKNFEIVGFNSRNFDLPILAIMLNGASCYDLHLAAQAIIMEGMRPAELLKLNKCKALSDINHIDLIEVAPLNGSLKVYGGRLHSPMMQDLPFDPLASLGLEQIVITRLYCLNDLTVTELLYKDLIPQINLRREMSVRYNVDLRSLSDAQIAEKLITISITKRSGRYIKRPEIAQGAIHKYAPPAWLKFQTALMKSVLLTVANTPFIVSKEGNIGMPEELKQLKIKIGNAYYQLGIGGLHSKESNTNYISNNSTVIRDFDVSSYYPSIILNLELYPEHLGKIFLEVYSENVKERLAAKKSNDTVTANTMKIVLNGSFGKFGSPYSNMYSPRLLIQVTLTGQLALLMLIELLELAGINVVSSNTDGVTIFCEKVKQYPIAKRIISDWEKLTSFVMEEVEYSSLFHRDVNSYIAVKANGVKTKGIFERAKLSKNPVNEVCIDAIENYLVKKIPIETSILECNDIRKFLTIRTVKGGAVKSKIFLGKVIRWYYSTEETGEIVYALSGNKVPRTDNASPLMRLCNELPVDLDRQWYINEAISILAGMGVKYPPEGLDLYF